MKCWLKQERLYRRWREMLEIKMKKTLIPWEVPQKLHRHSPSGWLRGSFWDVPDLWFLRYDNHVSCWATSFPSASKRWLSPAKEGKVLRNQNKLCSSWDRRFLGFDGLLITAQHRKFRIKLRIESPGTYMSSRSSYRRLTV
jgi:hypothetical protein